MNGSCAAWSTGSSNAWTHKSKSALWLFRKTGGRMWVGEAKAQTCCVLEATIWYLQGNAELAIDEPLGMTTGSTTSMHRILHGTHYWINTSLSSCKWQTPNLFGTSWWGGQERNSTTTQSHDNRGSNGGRDIRALPRAAVTRELGINQHVKARWQQQRWSLPKWEQRSMRHFITALRSCPWKHCPC